MMDTNYYTLSVNNTTQYRPGRRGDKEWKITPIWDHNHNLLEDVFDWERNWELFWRLGCVFPSLRLGTNLQLGHYIKDKVKEKYGSDSRRYEWAKTHVRGDENKTYHHDIHAHFFLEDEIKWDFKLKDWYN